MQNSKKSFLDGTTRRQFFEQEPPSLTINPFSSDKYLLSLLDRVFHKKEQDCCKKEIMMDLDQFAERTKEGGDVYNLAKRANQEENFPKLKKFNGWGKQIDEIVTCDEWKRLHDVAANEGLIAIAYERKHKHFSRLHQLLKLMIFAPVSATVTCPLAMTDASARLIETLKKIGKSSEQMEEYLRCLVSRDEFEFISAAQWMTERTGGSDVGNTETVASLDPSDKSGRSYLLNGYKYFTSSTTSNITFALARVVNEKGQGVNGSRGLSLFVTEVTNKKTGKFNNIIVHRLKEKIGTKPLPTAELELVNKPATLVGEIGEGVKTISTLFNLTRIHCVMSNIGAMRMMLFLMRDYAEKRRAFGKKLSQQPLHLATLSDCEVQYRGMLQLFVKESLIMGKVEVEAPESKKAEYHESLLRVITPIGKMMSGIVSSEMLLDGCESFGGAGYMTDTGFFQIMADAFVNRIWEGTGNIMSLDVLRCMSKEPGSIETFLEFINKNLKKSKVSQQLSTLSERVESAVKAIKSYLSVLPTFNALSIEAGSRGFAMTIGSVLVASLLIRHAAWSGDDEDVFVAERWIELRPLNRLVFQNEKRMSLESSLAMGKDFQQQNNNNSKEKRIPSKL